MSSKRPDITLYFLNSSRAIRIAWLLEALKLDYKLVSADRAPNGLAPPEFRQKIPGPLRKSPTISDGELVIQESQAILEYICETYDPSHHMIPSEPSARIKVREWMSASEGSFLMHGIAIMYARARLPANHKSAWPEMNTAMSPNMHNNLNWLDSTLKAQHEKGSKYIVGNNLTAADVSMLFGLQLIYDRKLGLEGAEEKGLRWENVERWIKEMQEEEESYRRAVGRTGFKMGGTL